MNPTYLWPPPTSWPSSSWPWPSTTRATAARPRHRLHRRQRRRARRHHRAVSSAATVGLGLGLFGVLSIIRLRSDELGQHEIAYYFAALAIGLIGGLGTGDVPLVRSP